LKPGLRPATIAAIRHFLNTYDWSRPEIEALLDDARALKKSPSGDALAGKTIALVFLNSSLRTRTSFEVGARQLGGDAVVLTPGGMWSLEFEEGAVMLGEAEEHAKEAAKVLSRYVDLIGVRAFPKLDDWQDDRKDKVLGAFAAHADVPVINMETITHPCQELALAMALQDRLGQLDGKKLLLTWSHHPKPLNTAVANSALMIAAKLGMDVTLLTPTEDYALDERYMRIARASAEAAAELDEGFYCSRWERATPAQRAYLEAMAEEDGDDPVATAGVAARLGRSQSAVGPHRDQLVEKGLIYSSKRGTVAFSVPGMGAYVERAAP